MDKIFGHFGPTFGILGLAKFQKIDFFQLKSIFSIKGPVTIEGLRGVVGVFWGCLDSSASREAARLDDHPKGLRVYRDRTGDRYIYIYISVYS